MTKRKYPQIEGLPTTSDGVLRAFAVMLPPETASLWFQRNVKNRPLKPNAIKNYVADIDTDQFYLTHQGIAFDTDGNLFDGQNRLMAIITAQKPAPVLVTVNIPTVHVTESGITFGAQDVIDEGHRRQIWHFLQDKNVPNPQKAAGAIWCLTRFCLQRQPPKLSPAKAAIVLDIFHDGLFSYLGSPLPKCCRNSGVYAALALLHYVHPSATRAFVDRLINCPVPTQHLACDGAQALLKRFSSEHPLKFHGNRSFGTLQYVLRAFDHWKRDTKVTGLREPGEQYYYNLWAKLGDQTAKMAAAFVKYSIKLDAPSIPSVIRPPALLDDTELTAAFMDVSPALATTWLESTPGATLQPAEEIITNRYAAFMRDHAWAVTHEAVAFDTKKALLDGKKRLNAIIRSQQTVKLLVVSNVPREVKHATSIGKARTAKDQLFRHHRAPQQASALRIIRSILVGTYKNGGMLTNSEAVHLSDVFGSSIDRLHNLAARLEAPRSLRTGDVIGPLALVHKAFPRKVEDFAKRFFTGARLDYKSKAHQLRERLNQPHQSGALQVEEHRRTVRDFMCCVQKKGNLTPEKALELIEQKSPAEIEKAKAVLNSFAPIPAPPHLQAEAIQSPASRSVKPLATKHFPA